MDRRTYLRGAGLVGAAMFGGCLDSRAAGGDYDVGMSTVAFRPREIKVPVGGEVVWRNTSKQGHTVTAYENLLPADADYFASGGYDSEKQARNAWFDGFGGRLASGDTYRHTFEVAGDHDYFCIPHESERMLGTVIVEG
ncbi:MAG: plastocyanin/azurin family copper-binding protein [Salinirussus sp.]